MASPPREGHQRPGVTRIISGFGFSPPRPSPIQKLLTVSQLQITILLRIVLSSVPARAVLEVYGIRTNWLPGRMYLPCNLGPGVQEESKYLKPSGRGFQRALKRSISPKPLRLQMEISCQLPFSQHFPESLNVDLRCT